MFFSDSKAPSTVSVTERKGLELSVDSALPNNFKFYAAYTLMNAEYKDSFECFGTSVDVENGCGDIRDRPGNDGARPRRENAPAGCRSF